MNSRYLALVAGVVVATAIASHPAAAKPLTSPALVRSGPGETWPVFAQIPAGANVHILNCYSGWDGGWCQVRHGKVTGYVDIGTLAPSGANNVEIAPYVTNNIVNLRKGPGYKWASIAAIPFNTPVNVAYCSQGWLSGWCKVSYEGQTGFVNAAGIQRKGVLY
jgi:uncharacterized protein YraI